MNSKYRLFLVWGVPDAHMASRPHGGKGGSRAPDPNPGLIRQAEVSEKLGQRYLDQADEQFQWTKERYDELKPMYDEVMAEQLNQMRQQSELAQDYADYNRTTFRPLEQQMIQEAQEFDSEANQEAAATRAGADVISAYDRARGDLTARMQSFGVKMNSPAALAAMKGLEIDQAANISAAHNKAREDTKMIGRAMRADAINLGRGLPSQQATAAGLALGAGGAATGTAASQTQQYLSGTDSARAWMGGATAAHGQAGSIYNNIYQGQLNAWSAQNANAAANAAGIGSMVGTIAGSFFGPVGTAVGGAMGNAITNSDVNAKTDIVPVDEEEALEGIKSVPVSSWRYKGGIGDGGAVEHVGPMAQDMQREFGDEVAPGGKQIDLVSANGLAMLGIKALAKKVDELEAEVKPAKKKRKRRAKQGFGVVKEAA